MTFAINIIVILSNFFDNHLTTIAILSKRGMKQIINLGNEYIKANSSIVESI